jgi:hypothetical protein
MNDIESRLRGMDLRPPRDLPARALAAAASRRRRPRRGLRLAALVIVLAALLAGYSAVSLAAVPPASAAGTSGYGVWEGCWFVKDSGGLHFHVGGWYRGLPALCTSERR